MTQFLYDPEAEMQVDEPSLDEHVYIEEMHRILDRDEKTIRRWVRESSQIYDIVGEVPEGRGLLPRDLWPEHETEGRRRLFWHRDQVESLKDFVYRKSLRRGWGGARRG